MNIDVNIFQFIQITCTAIAAILGIIVYIRQQKMSRIQNLIAVFQRFANNDDFISIFNCCDSAYVRLNNNALSIELNSYIEGLQNIPPDKKLKYLALLEEITIYAKHSAVIRKHSFHLFKFHFYYVYGNHPISIAFWDNVGGSNEKDKEGWSYQKEFAHRCEQIILKK